MAGDSRTELYEVESLPQLIDWLKAEQGDSYATLGAKMGISASTLHRIVKGGKADDETLDKIADYAGLPHVWLYDLAKGIPSRPRYSRTVSVLAALLEQAPPDIQENVLVMARALIESRKKKAGKIERDDEDLVGT